MFFMIHSQKNYLITSIESALLHYKKLKVYNVKSKDTHGFSDLILIK
jgi:hypothetical protein